MTCEVMICMLHYQSYNQLQEVKHTLNLKIHSTWWSKARNYFSYSESNRVKLANDKFGVHNSKYVKLAIINLQIINFYLSKSWSYNTELSPLVRYSGSPKERTRGASGFSLHTPWSLCIPAYEMVNVRKFKGDKIDKKLFCLSTKNQKY